MIGWTITILYLLSILAAWWLVFRAQVQGEKGKIDGEDFAVFIVGATLLSVLGPAIILFFGARHISRRRLGKIEYEALARRIARVEKKETERRPW